VFRYGIVVGIIPVSVLPLVCGLLGMTYNVTLKVPVTAKYVFYAMAGYYIHKTTLRPKDRYIIYACGIAGWLMRFLAR